MKIFKKGITLGVLTIILASCNTNSERQKTAYELKQELKTQEQINPTDYLSATATLAENITQKPNLFRHTKKDGYILSGSITNSSTIARFKDVIITVTYLSETESPIDSKDYVMYKYFNASTKTPFEYKVYPPDGFKNFSIEVKAATSAN